MPGSQKILLIENQFRQYQTIASFLTKHGFKVFPDQQNYVDFNDRIRVILNPRYMERCDIVLKQLLTSITSELELKDFDALIIDHILVGNDASETGIDLAIKFRRAGMEQPIIFLSWTDITDVEVCRTLPKVPEKKVWVAKGYSGFDLFEKNILEEELLPKLMTLLAKNKGQLAIELLRAKRHVPKGGTVDSEWGKIGNVIDSAISKVEQGVFEVTEEVIKSLEADLDPKRYARKVKEIFGIQ